MPKRRNAQEAERLQKTAKDISEKLGLKLPDKPSDKPPARLNPTGYKVAQGNLAPDSQSQPYPKTELDHDLDGSLLSLWGADDKLTTAVHDLHEPLLQSTRVSVARASVATNAHRSSGVGGPVPPAGDHRLSVLAIPKVSHMDSKVGEQRASRPMRRSVAKRTAFIMAPPTTVSLDRTKSTSAGKHDPLTDEPSADAEGGDVVMTDNANASSAGTASGVGAASGGGLAVGSMPGSGGHDGLIASPDTFRSRHGSITLTPGGKLPSSFSQNTGILAGSITALTTSNPGLLGSLTTISNPTHGQPSSGRSDPHPTWLSVETDPGASTRINRAHRDSVFGKAPTGRLPGQSLISPKGKRPSQSEEALSVMLVGQKVKYKPDKDAHQHSQHHDMHMSQDDGLHQSMDGNVPDETIDGPAVIMEDAEEEDDDDQLQMLRRSRNGRAGPIHLAPMIVGDGHASDDDDAADHRHHGQASHGLSSVGHVSHAGHTAGADSKRGETHHKHEEVEPFDFDQVDDVDQISTRYAAIIEARARKLRGEDVPTPPPMTPAEIIKREVVKPTAAAAFLGVNGRGRFDAAAHNAVAPDDEVEDEDDEDEDEEKEEEEEEEEDAKSSESGSDSSGEEEEWTKTKQTKTARAIRRQMQEGTSGSSRCKSAIG
ncbi:hypothetical protein BC831DRAFT_506633 [Entophlyctis helioformis]|nr:hypothetical protein BC831DRAFT_506633 [Entophlyctis helioformis]